VNEVSNWGIPLYFGCGLDRTTADPANRPPHQRHVKLRRGAKRIAADHARRRQAHKAMQKTSRRRNRREA
jgi:hypothetical protein